MSKDRIICFTPDRNVFPAAVFAAKRLLAQGLDQGTVVAIVCTEGDIDAQAMADSDPRLEILIHPFDTQGNLSISTLPLGRHLTPASWRRLLLPHVLPDHFGRIVYLDCDTLAVGPKVSRLLTVDHGGLPFAAAIDMIRLKDFEDGPLTAGFQAYRATLGLERDAPYLNSGVLTIDRDRWRGERLSERTIAFARQHAAVCQFQDQSALNAVARGRWGVLSPRFNFMGDFLLLDLMHEIEPVLLHFVNSPKPWQGDVWKGPAWMQALYDIPDATLPATSTEPLERFPIKIKGIDHLSDSMKQGYDLSSAFRRFRQRLMAFLADQRFIDGPLPFTRPTDGAPAPQPPRNR